MATGSSGRGNPVSQGFDFGTDDILCSYEDYGNQDSSNGNHNEPVMGNNPGKDFHKSRMSRQSMFSSPAYSQPEESLHQDVIATVEKSMKKYADNLMRFLEGISSRLSQLELYCYNLDKSIGEMRSDLGRDHEEADSKLKSLEKHLQEVHRSVQILRDKQELAETQKELAKLQLAQKGSGSSIHSQSNEERASPHTSDAQKADNPSETHNQQLALALPHQVAPQQQPVAAPTQPPPQNVTQQQSYYLPTQLQNPPPQAHPQNQYLPPDSQYRNPQVQEMPRVTPQPTQSQLNQTQVQSFPQYQQQLPQSQQVQFPQQPSMQPQMRPPPTNVYPYPPGQQTNPSPPESAPNSMPMQVPYSNIPQPGSGRSDPMPFGYGGAGRTMQQQPPPQQIKGAFGAQPGEGYGAAGPHPALPPVSTYMVYDSEGGRTQYSAHYGYPPTSISHHTPQPTTAPNLMARNPQFPHNHPYNELIEKLVPMGFRSDHVVSVIQRMEESGQPVDFNAVIDRLNAHPSGVPQRGWSG